jgi:glycosyltransferase involved in cell wall biosynthesis
VNSQPRVALVSNLCPHYRRPLYELLATRFDLDCFFFAESEPYWNPRLPAFVDGDFRNVPMRRLHVLGEPLLPGLTRRLTLDRYDAVVIGLTGRLMVPFVYAVARVRRLPLVLWTGLWRHPRTSFHRVTERIVRVLYRRSDAIVVYGEHVRRALCAIPGVAVSKIFVANQAVDARLFSVLSDPARSKRLIFVGQYQEWKGLADLVAAFGQVEDPGLSLALVGSGPLEAMLRRAAAEDPRITVLGHVPQEELPRLLADSRCLVLPSVTTDAYAETWGLVVNEAMHAGLPVVATTAVGAAAAGLVEDQATGLVVQERDPAAALATIARDDQLVAALGRRAREQASTYTFEEMAAAFEAAVEYARRRHE